MLLKNTGVKVKVFRRNNTLGKSYKVLLPALSRTCLENSYNRIFHKQLYLVNPITPRKIELQ